MLILQLFEISHKTIKIDKALICENPHQFQAASVSCDFRTSLWSEEIANNSFLPSRLSWFSLSLARKIVLDLIIIHIAVYIVALTINLKFAALVFVHLNNWKQNAPKAKNRTRAARKFSAAALSPLEALWKGKN